MFSLDEKLKPQPDLAAGWPRKRDITSSAITLELKRAMWSDRTPITASDVRFSWEKLRKGPTGYRYRYLTDVEVLGPRKLRLRFNHPMRRWWSLFSVDDMVLPAHAYSASWKNGPTVSGGPFSFKSWTKGLKISLVRNNAYFGDKAKAGAVDVEFVPEDETRLKLLDRSQLDAFFSPGDANMGRRAAAFGFPRTSKATAGRGASGAWASAWWEIDFDTRRIGPDVAAAIGQAVDPALAAEIFEDSGQIADGIPRRFPAPGAAADSRPAVAGPWAGRGNADLARRALAGGPRGRVINSGGNATVTVGFDRDSAAAALAGFMHFRLLPLRIRLELVGLDTEDFETLLASPKVPPAVIRLRRGADAPDASAYVFGGIGSAESAAADVAGAETTGFSPSKPVTGLDPAGWAAAQRRLEQAHAVYPLVRAREWIVARDLAGPRATGTSAGPFWNAATWRFT